MAQFKTKNKTNTNSTRVKMMWNFSLIQKFAVSEQGATAIEYALIASGISVAIIGTVTALGGNLLGLFETVQSSLN